METIKDYIAWYKDIDLEARPFGTPDAMTLCVVSYFDLSPMMDPNGSPFYLKDAIPNIESGKLKIRITGPEEGLNELLLEIAKSKRFGDLVISNYVEEFDEEKSIQFAAVCFNHESDFSVIAYRGTDNTLVGWKEDFMMAYTKTGAQQKAFEYADKLIEPEKHVLFGKEYTAKDSGFSAGLARLVGSRKQPRRWFIAGHSKGANLAMYAASQLPEEKLNLVEKVYSLDGPGFAPEVIEVSALQRIDDKCLRVIPEYCVVGHLMEPALSDTKIVKSVNEGLMQHSIVSWGIEHGDIALCEDQNPKERWINQTLKNWIEDMPYEVRRTFVDEFFDALSAGGATTVNELFNSDRESKEAVFKKALGFSEPTKKLVFEFAGAAAQSAKDKIGQLASQVTSHIPTPEEVIEAAKKALDFIGQELSDLRK